MNYYDEKIEKCFEKLNTTNSGLLESEVHFRQEEFGKNELPKGKKVPNVIKFLRQFCDVMIIILLIASLISITVSILEKTYSEMVDGFIILGIVFLNALIGFLQEIKSEKEMLSLQKLTMPEAKVRREGKTQKIPASELVVGDIVILEAGDIVPADLRLTFATNIKIDESSLTGESVQVEKSADIICKTTSPLAERKNMAYKGTVVGIGRAEGLVVAIGKDTELGKIASILTHTKNEQTPLQKNIKQLGKIITVVVLLIATITFVLELCLSPNKSVISAFLTAVALSVAAIPESLPAVITIIMSMGVMSLGKKKALVKNLYAVETLGSCEIICSDKTGTLTQNAMTVQQIFYNNEQKSAEKFSGEDFVMLIKTMALCNDSQKVGENYVGDPTEIALNSYADFCGLSKSQLEIENVRVDEIPFDSTRKLMTVINKQNGIFTAYTKGAIDVILKLCDSVLINGEKLSLDENFKKSILSANEKMASRSLRVLGFAIKNNVTLGEVSENNLTFVGLVGMMDPPRKEAKYAVQMCKLAHMTPIMITGDHKDTAFAVAKEIGICSNKKQVLLGSQLDALSELEFKKIIQDIKVYARVSPENKVRIVKTYQELGKIVAMTGDGVNDAPALKCADIGVGMGIMGTDVTKEVADVIVTDDNFSTIVVAVSEGRRIFANLVKTIMFLFSANIGEILSIFLATILFPNFTFLSPVQILFVNLLTDSFPSISLGLEPPEADLMTKCPRKKNASIFANGIGFYVIIMGIWQTFAILLSFFVGIKVSGGDNILASSMAFLTLNVVQIAYLISMRTSKNFFKTNPFANKWVNFSILTIIASLFLIELTPIHTFLGICSVGAVNYLIILAFAIIVFLLSELTKFVRKRIFENKK